ncbi:MAG: sulfatase-like hydrolase/transferase, partial [Planctomycetota bacterium]
MRTGSYGVLGGWVVAATLAVASWAIAQTASASRPPNIVLIIADDMNWDDCGAYGHPSIRTPNIDRLADEGLLFQHAYLTTSSCSPSRASIITGKYPHNTGAEQLHWPIPKGSVTFVEKLKS